MTDNTAYCMTACLMLLARAHTQNYSISTRDAAAHYVQGLAYVRFLAYKFVLLSVVLQILLLFDV